MKLKAKKKSTRFYIAVYGYTHSDYTIIAEVIRTDQEDNVVELVNGISHRSELSDQLRTKYFKFFVDFDKKDEEDRDIEINLKGPKDKIELYVNSDGTLPDNEDTEDGGGFEFISHSGYLFISSEIEGFINNGNYYIAVVATERAFDNPSGNDHDSKTSIQFTITITSSLGTKVLNLNEPFYDVVEAKSDKLYSIRIDPVTQYLMFSRNVMSYGEYPDFYIGDHPDEDENNFTYKISGDTAQTT